MNKRLIALVLGTVAVFAACTPSDGGGDISPDLTEPTPALDSPSMELPSMESPSMELPTMESPSAS